VLFTWKSGFNNHFLYFITTKHYLKRYILANIIIVLLFPIAAICRSTWRKEVLIYVLLSFKCYLYENLDLIIIFFYFITRKIYLKRYILTNIIIVLLFPIAAICRSSWRKEVIIYVLHGFKCYLHENLDLIIIFCTLLQKQIV
jgi:hypothetical protein